MNSKRRFLVREIFNKWSRKDSFSTLVVVVLQGHSKEWVAEMFNLALKHN